MIIISVDIGLTGYISVLQKHNEELILLEYVKIPTDLKKDELSSKSKYYVKKQIDYLAVDIIIKDLKASYSDDNEPFFMCFEQISTRKGFAVSSAMSLADSQATFRCIALQNNIEYFPIAPSKWKKKLGLSKDKDESINFLNKMIINKDIKVLNKVIKNHNFIESVLIGYYFSLIDKVIL